MNTENRNNVRLKMIVGKILDASKYGGMVGMVWMVGMIGMLGWAGRNRTYNIEYRMYNNIIHIYIYIYMERGRERTKHITLKRTEKGVRLKREKLA